MSQVETHAEVRLNDEGQLVVGSLTLLNSIGKGSYGEVALAVDGKQGGKQVAVKCMSRTRLAKSAVGSGFQNRAPRAAVAESLALSVLGDDQPNIITMYRSVEDPSSDDIYFVLELAGSGAAMSLDEANAVFSARCGDVDTRVVGASEAEDLDVEAHAALATELGLQAAPGAPSPSCRTVPVRVFSEDAAALIVRDVLEALKATHSHGFAHRDVSPGNVLLKPNGTALLADFGVCSSADVDITAAAEAAARGVDIDEAPERAPPPAPKAQPRGVRAAEPARTTRGSFFGSIIGRSPPEAVFTPAPPKPNTKPPRPSTPPPQRHSTSRAARVKAMASTSAEPPALRPVWVQDMQGPYAFQPPEACGYKPAGELHDESSAASGAGGVSVPSGAAVGPDGHFDACRADLWMLGCTLHCFLTGRQPLGRPGDGPMDLFAAVEAAARAEHGSADGGSGGVYEPPGGVSAECASFLRGLFQCDAARRLTAVQALAHPWLASRADSARRTFAPLGEGDMRPYGSATLAMLKSEVALRRDVETNRPRVSFAVGDAASALEGAAGEPWTGPQQRLRVRRDSTPVPPAGMPPPDGAVDGDGTVCPLFEGWLQKRGRIRRSWQPRYVYVRDGDLFYFKAAPTPEEPLAAMSREELQRRCAGQMKLHPIDDVGRCPKPGKPLRFSVQAAGRVLFLMPAEGADDGEAGRMAEEAELVMERWLAGFEQLRKAEAAPSGTATH